MTPLETIRASVGLDAVSLARRRVERAKASVEDLERRERELLFQRQATSEARDLAAAEGDARTVSTLTDQLASSATRAAALDDEGKAWRGALALAEADLSRITAEERRERLREQLDGADSAMKVGVEKYRSLVSQLVAVLDDLFVADLKAGSAAQGLGESRGRILAAALDEVVRECDAATARAGDFTHHELEVRVPAPRRRCKDIL